MLYSYLKRLKKVHIYIITLFIIIIIPLTYFYPINNIDGIMLKATPMVDNSIKFVGDEFFFNSSKSIGHIKEYLWDFNDGNFSIEKNPSHAYYSPKWYYVTLSIISHDGLINNSTLVIGVQNTNVSEFYHSRAQVVIRPKNSILIEWGSQIGPNIKNPDIKILINMTKATGSFNIHIYIQSNPNTDNSITTEIIREDFHLSEIIQSNNLPEYVSNSISIVVVEIILNQGAWIDASILIIVDYSIANIIPPE